MFEFYGKKDSVVIVDRSKWNIGVGYLDVVVVVIYLMLGDDNFV